MLGQSAVSLPDGVVVGPVTARRLLDDVIVGVASDKDGDVSVGRRLD